MDGTVLDETIKQDRPQQTESDFKDRVDSRLQRSFLRNNPAAADDQEDEAARIDETDSSIYDNLKEKNNERILKILKRREKAVVDQIQKEVTKKTVQIASKISMRAVNTALGASIIGIIVVHIVWTIQLIAGNILGSKTIPPLDLGEQILWALLTGLLFIIVIGILIIMEIIIHPFSHLDLIWQYGILRSVSIFLGVLGEAITNIVT